MWGRAQLFVALAVASLLVVILVSPAAPSPPTTVQAKCTINHHNGRVCIGNVIDTTLVRDAGILREIISAEPTCRGVSHSDVLDLTAARRC